MTNVINFSDFLHKQQPIQHPYILKNLKKVQTGRYEGYHSLGIIYEKGLGVRPNAAKAIEMFEKFYEIHRNQRIKVDTIQLLINIGKLYLKLGDKIKAAESFVGAGLEVLQLHDKKEHKRLLKKYNIEKLIKKTGCENVIL